MPALDAPVGRDRRRRDTRPHTSHRNRLTDDASKKDNPIWVGQKDFVIYQSDRAGARALWEISIRSSQSWQLPVQSPAAPLSASSDGSWMTFQHDATPQPQAGTPVMRPPSTLIGSRRPRGASCFAPRSRRQDRAEREEKGGTAEEWWMHAAEATPMPRGRERRNGATRPYKTTYR